MTLLQDTVVTDRGGVIENQHLVHAAVVDATGNLLYAVGNPSRMTLARSAAKPAQALAILETGGFVRFGFDDADLALICASHSSEPRHIERTRAMLEKVGALESDLKCGGHAALSEVVNRAWIKSDFVPNGAYNNCSGKHVGMLAGCKALGVPIEDYHQSEHEMQVRVKRTFEELAGLSTGITGAKWAIDGCNLPAPGMPLDHLARMYASFAQAADMVNDTSSERTRYMARIFNAMSRYPEMVGGENRYCTDLMTAFDGALIGKLGADGCYGIAIRSSTQTQHLGATGALGISVKIEDGNIEILYAVVTEILEQLQIGDLGTRSQLAHYHHLKRINTMNVVTGSVTPVFKVRKESLNFII